MQDVEKSQLTTESDSLASPADGTLLHLQFSLSDLPVPESNSQSEPPEGIVPNITAEELLSQVFPCCGICHKTFLNR